MTKKRFERVYAELTAKERAGLVHLASVNGGKEPPEVRNTMPSSQIQEFNRLMRLGSAQTRVIGPLASELAFRVQVANLRCLLAHQIEVKVDLLDALLKGRQQDPEGFVSECDDEHFDEENQLPDDRESVAVLIALVEEDLPKIQRELLAVNSEFQRILDELGVIDHPEPTIAKLIDDAVENADLVRRAMNLAFSSSIAASDGIDCELVEEIRSVI